MKKTLKYISAFIASAIVAVPLCSCEKIDNMRERQILKNTSGDELFYNGSTYNFMLYDSDDSYRLISSVYEMGMYRDETMKITDADVPVLLIDEFGESATISANNNIIKDDLHHNIYVKADVFDKYSEYIKNLEFNHYFIRTSHYDSKNDYVKITPKLIPNDLADEISDIIEHPENYNSYNEDTVFGSIDIMSCDTEMLFETESSIQILFLSDGFAIDFYDKASNEYYSIMIPEKYSEALEELLADDDNYHWAFVYATETGYEFFYD